MSTNAVAVVYGDFDDVPLVAIYKHWDGYPSGFGEKLKKIAAQYDLVNGLSLSDGERKVANGMGCFAAFLIQELKEGPGDVYLVPTSDLQTEQYNYTLKPVNGEIVVDCEEGWDE
jgi:hypothetical protein